MPKFAQSQLGMCQGVMRCDERVLLPMALRGCLVRHSPGVVLVHRLKAWLKALTSE
jgi:hypothetical protein